MTLRRIAAFCLLIFCACVSGDSQGTSPAKNHPREIALLQAVVLRNLERVKELVAEGADVNYLPHNSTPKYPYRVQTPLEQAASIGSVEIVRFLLESGAVLRGDAYLGIYALHSAAQVGAVETAEILMKSGEKQKFSKDFWGSALITASRNGYLEVVRLFLDAGLDPNWHTSNGIYPETALIAATNQLKFDVSELLLDRGAHPEGAPYQPEFTPIMKAAWGGNDALVKRLVSLGADPTRKSSLGNAVSYASCAAHSVNPELRMGINRAVMFLVQSGAGINETTSGRTALNCARLYDNQDLAKFLVEKGAKDHRGLGDRLSGGFKAIGKGIVAVVYATLVIFGGGH